MAEEKEEKRNPIAAFLLERFPQLGGLFSFFDNPRESIASVIGEDHSKPLAPKPIVDAQETWESMGRTGPVPDWARELIQHYDSQHPRHEPSIEMVWKAAGQKGDVPEFFRTGQYEGPGGAKEFFMQQQGYVPMDTLIAYQSDKAIKDMLKTFSPEDQKAFSNPDGSINLTAVENKNAEYQRIIDSHGITPLAHVSHDGNPNPVLDDASFNIPNKGGSRSLT